MIRKRLIAVLVLRDGQVVQSEKFNHNHVIHYDAIHAVDAFSRWDVDEIILLNVSRDRNSQYNFAQIVEHVSSCCWVPLSAGGHVDNVNYAAELINRGADKLVLNTSFSDDINVPRAIAGRFGRQCVIASIDVRDNRDGEKEVWVDRASRNTGSNLNKWIELCNQNGAGEIMINNVSHDGNRKGYDIDSLKIAVASSPLPVIAFGGAALNEHFAQGLKAGVSAVAAANMFHYKEMATKSVKRYLLMNGFNLRKQ